jgi:hypothetical protein
MNPSPSYYLVFFLPNGCPAHKKVEVPLFRSLAQNEVITEVQIAKDTYTITSRRSFNIFNSTTADYFLILDLIIKPE